MGSGGPSGDRGFEVMMRGQERGQGAVNGTGGGSHESTGGLMDVLSGNARYARLPGHRGIDGG